MCHFLPRINPAIFILCLIVPFYFSFLLAAAESTAYLLSFFTTSLFLQPLSLLSHVSFNLVHPARRENQLNAPLKIEFVTEHLHNTS